MEILLETCSSRFRISWGGSKSGKPWDRLTAPYWLEMRVMRRMTESVKPAVREDNAFICFLISSKEYKNVFWV